jgi:hypothetical protein
MGHHHVVGTTGMMVTIFAATFCIVSLFWFSVLTPKDGGPFIKRKKKAPEREGQWQISKRR